MRGRKPKPTALKLLEGNPGKRPLPKREPKPKVAAQNCPAWLSAEARREWRRIAPELIRCGLVTIADRPVLALFCDQFARATIAATKVREAGEVIKSPSEFPILNPWLGVATKAAALALKLAAELGITPSSRTRVQSVSHSEAASRLQKFIGSKEGMSL